MFFRASVLVVGELESPQITTIGQAKFVGDVRV